MSTIDEQQESEARWDAAAQLAAGVDDPGVHVRRRRILRLFAWLLVASMVLGVIVGLLGIVFGLREPGSSSDNGVWAPRDIAGLAFELSGFVIFVGGYVWAWRTGQFVMPWRTIASPLSMAQRRSINKQVRGKAPIDEEHRTVIVAIARQGQGSSALLVAILGGLVCLIVGLILLAETRGDYVVPVIEMAALLALTPVVAWSRRRLVRFIAANSDDH